MGRKKSLRNFLYIILGGILATILYLEYQRLQEGFQEPKSYSIFATVSNNGGTIKIDDKSDNSVDYKTLTSMGVRVSTSGNTISIMKLNASLGSLSDIDVYSRKGRNTFIPLPMRYVDMPLLDVVKFYANGDKKNFIRKPPVEGKDKNVTSNEISLEKPKPVGPGGVIQSIHVTGLKGTTIQLGKVPDKTDIQIILRF